MTILFHPKVSPITPVFGRAKPAGFGAVESGVYGVRFRGVFGTRLRLMAEAHRRRFAVLLVWRVGYPSGSPVQARRRTGERRNFGAIGALPDRISTAGETAAPLEERVRIGRGGGIRTRLPFSQKGFYINKLD